MGMNIPSQRLLRQSFLGDCSEQTFSHAVVGVVGIGGGGSHVVQQLAHIGFQNFVLYDADRVEESNLNRMIGAEVADVTDRTLKVDVAERLIRKLWPSAAVRKYAGRWQGHPQLLRSCDIVFGCVDGFAERGELESCTRRYLIPLIDIGMDVQPAVAGQPPRMAGQVILSMPGEPCMRCLQFLSESTLAREAARYGAAGHNPQVVWSNGALASTAVGLAVDLLTGWTQRPPGAVYLSYDGNTGTIQPHVRLGFLDRQGCVHFPLAQVGDPVPVLL
jgi:hypothetical protein